MSAEKLAGFLDILQDAQLLEWGMEKEDLNLKAYCPHIAKHSGKGYSSFFLVLKKVDVVSFSPWEDEQLEVTDLNEIRLLKPVIVSSEVKEDNIVQIYCQCDHLYEGGNIRIRCADVRLFDEEFNELTLQDLQVYADAYWLSETTDEE